MRMAALRGALALLGWVLAGVRSCGAGVCWAEQRLAHVMTRLQVAELLATAEAKVRGWDR